jgi:hypothetical protein
MKSCPKNPNTEIGKVAIKIDNPSLKSISLSFLLNNPLNNDIEILNKSFLKKISTENIVPI